MPFARPVLAGLVFLSFASIAGAQPTTAPAAPDFGPNVLIFDPSTPDVQHQINAVFATQEAGQFNDSRYAFLFKPGHYDLDVQVGFYTQVCGLGRSPDEVAITGAVRAKAGWMRGNNATCNFWRTAENLSVTPTTERANVWAVSQATALRRVHVRGDLNLWDGGWSSGGFLADCAIDGAVVSGSQQQWISRNADWGNWRGGVWNMVFVGCPNPPAGEWPKQPFTTIERTPVIREKPFLTIDDASRFSVFVPRLRSDSVGTTWQHGTAPGKSIPIDRFYLAHPDSDSAATINAALARGLNLLLTPGIYHLDAPIRVARPDTVVLGLGLATLVAERGTPAMTLADVDGLTVAGVLFEAGDQKSPTLLQVGEPDASADHAANPTALFDVFARAGGARPGQCDSFMEINSSQVVADNLWLWRADHGAGAGWTTNPVKNGLIVNGSNVTIYGLFNEHTQEYQTLWNGERGRVYLYQSEFPYDPPTQDAWQHDGTRGWASYKVGDKVTTHEAWGLGAYTVFHEPGIVVDPAIQTPTAPGIQMHHMVTRRLSAKPGSGGGHVWNDRGGPMIEVDHASVD